MATSHMYSDKKYFNLIESTSGTIKCVSKSLTVEIKSVGHIVRKLSSGMGITLFHVLCIPDLNGQLISIRKIENSNYSVIFKNVKGFTEKGRKCFGEHDLNGQYKSDFVPDCEIVLTSKEDDNEL